ncbi:hypothetical protein P9112_014363 [Eukaryota sp. TZLM1-RC]
MINTLLHHATSACCSSFVCSVGYPQFSALALLGTVKLHIYFIKLSCDDNIPELLGQVKDRRELFSTLSFELFNLGPQSTLIRDSEGDLSDPSDFYDRYDLPTLPMVSSYPPERRELTEWFRQLLENPMPFINEVVANTTRYSGIQIDIEPSWTEPNEIHGYIKFVNLLSREMHKRGKTVTLAVASWVKAFNDFETLCTCDADAIITMDTYTSGKTTDDHTNWDRAFFKMINACPKEKAGIGIMTTNPNTNKPLSDEEVAHRFEMLKKYDVQHVGLWKGPIPENMYHHVIDYIYN